MDRVKAVRRNPFPMLLEHAGEFLQRLDFRIDRPAIPVPKIGIGPSRRLVVPERFQIFFRDMNGVERFVEREQLRKTNALFPAHLRAISQEKIARAFDDFPRLL